MSDSDDFSFDFSDLGDDISDTKDADTNDGFDLDGMFDNAGTGSNTSDSSDDFGEFAGNSDVQQATEVSQGKGAIFKQATIIAIIGIIVVILAFVVVKKINGGSPKDAVIDSKPSTTQTDNSNTDSENKPTNSGVANNSSGWLEFREDSGLTFMEDMIDSNFTVTDIKHNAKIVDGDNNLMVKTVLTGTLSGFVGTYELEVPYYKGHQLSVGKSFNVSVQLGSLGEKRVVGEIKY